MSLNLFNIVRYFESGVLPWLRVLVLAMIVGGIYVYQFSPLIGGGIAVAGVLSIVVYLLWSTSVDTGQYCPSPPVMANLAVDRALKAPSPLPKEDPFRHTILYYTTLDSLNPVQGTLIEKTGLYALTLDGRTSDIGIKPDGETKTTHFGAIPVQTLVQIAVIHDEREIRVFVNGHYRGSAMREGLPPSSAVDGVFKLNQGAVVKGGTMYQVEIHKGVMSKEALRLNHEEIVVKYSNDATFQGVPYPTAKGSENMSFGAQMLGWVRMAGSLFGYESGLSP